MLICAAVYSYHDVFTYCTMRPTKETLYPVSAEPTRRRIIVLAYLLAVFVFTRLPGFYKTVQRYIRNTTPSRSVVWFAR